MMGYFLLFPSTHIYTSCLVVDIGLGFIGFFMLMCLQRFLILMRFWG